MNQERPSEKKQWADLCWREAPSCTCAEWAAVAVGHMQVPNTLCWLAWRLLTASCSLREGAFLHAAMSPVVSLPYLKLNWQALRSGC